MVHQVKAFDTKSEFHSWNPLRRQRKPIPSNRPATATHVLWRARPRVPRTYTQNK